MKKAWELERELRDSAVPVDRRLASSNWLEAGFEYPQGDELLKMYWRMTVPGSLAIEVPYQTMVQAWSNQGYDVSEADALIPEGLRLREAENIDELKVLTARLLKALREAPAIEDHPYHKYHHPALWDDVKSAMPGSKDYQKLSSWKDSYEQKVYQGWIGQFAGASFGTAIEGYVGKQIAKVYGELRSYVTDPETMNDDVVYELLLLDVYEEMGNTITSDAIADEWIRQLPYGVSAEGCALRNLKLGIYPPESGSFLNPYSDWIGAQMRGMVCGFLAPADPLEAARLSHIDGVISHFNNGVYGEIYGAVLTSLSFEIGDTRELVVEGSCFIPAGSEYEAKVAFVLDVLKNHKLAKTAWPVLDEHFKKYNWIHAYPNIAADLLALWYGDGDFTESMSLLALAGYDVDCNGGLVGSVLGVIQDVPEKWAEPIGDLLETYIVGKERLSIRNLADKTCRLAKL